MKNIITSALASLLLLPVGATASTFNNYTPESFQRVLNNAVWDDPSTQYNFYGLEYCNDSVYTNYSGQSSVVGYHCNFGYVQVRSGGYKTLCTASKVEIWRGQLRWTKRGCMDPYVDYN